MGSSREDAQTINFTTQKERFLRQIIVKTEIVTERTDHQNSTGRPIANNTVTTTPGEFPRDLLAVCVEFQ